MTAPDLTAQIASLVDAGHIEQAAELSVALGRPVAPLLAGLRDNELVGLLPEDIRDREYRLHAVWCAWQVRHLWRPEDRDVLRRALLVAWRYARGRATDAQLDAARDAARAAARAAARDAAWAAARAAAWAAAGDAAKAAQQQRLVARVCQFRGWA